MPLIQLDTSCDLSSADKQEALARTLSRLAAEATGKSERYVMASIRGNVVMTLGGEIGPCALLTIKAIGGLSQAVNQTLTKTAGQALENELGIARDRIYATFEELPPTHWGWNGSTFG